jgi:hypothetical protein
MGEVQDAEREESIFCHQGAGRRVILDPVSSPAGRVQRGAQLLDGPAYAGPGDEVVVRGNDACHRPVRTRRLGREDAGRDVVVQCINQDPKSG